MSKTGAAGQILWGILIIVAYYFPSFDENTAGLIGLSLIPIGAIILTLAGLANYYKSSRRRIGPY